MKYLFWCIVVLLSIIVFIMGRAPYDNDYEAIGGVYIAVTANFILSILILGVLCCG